jgi:hypothetical protein
MHDGIHVIRTRRLVLIFDEREQQATITGRRSTSGSEALDVQSTTISLARLEEILVEALFAKEAK